jgi:type I restriction enzyme S subunit
MMKKNIFNVPNLRFAGFEGDWECYKASDLLEFFTTNSLSWEQLEYNVENMYNLHYGLIHNGAPALIDTDSYKLPNVRQEYIPKTYTLCQDGDVAFADASEDTADVAKVVEFLNCNGKKIACGLHTIHGRDKFDKTVKGFKGYAFSSPAFHRQMRRLAQGTKIYSVNRKNFSECFIGIPPKDEQAKIAHLMQLLDNRIVNQSKIIENLKLLKDVMRNKIFKQIKKSTLYTLQIRDLLEYEQPTKYIVTDMEYSGDCSLTPVLTANKAFILGYTSENSGIYFKGKCIILDDFTMDLKFVDFPFKVKSSAIKILTAKKGVNLRFIYEYLSVLKLTSSEHKRHYISEIEPMYVSLPEIDIQNNTANVLSILDNKINLEIQRYGLLIKQKKYLLQQMFSCS